ncbi:hypothetical protein GCM10020219_047730 [Nonomuraea dietziae]
MTDEVADVVLRDNHAHEETCLAAPQAPRMQDRRTLLHITRSPDLRTASKGRDRQLGSWSFLLRPTRRSRAPSPGSGHRADRAAFSVCWPNTKLGVRRELSLLVSGLCPTILYLGIHLLVSTSRP